MHQALISESLSDRLLPPREQHPVDLINDVQETYYSDRHRIHISFSDIYVHFFKQGIFIFANFFVTCILHFLDIRVT